MLLEGDQIIVLTNISFYRFWCLQEKKMAYCVLSLYRTTPGRWPSTREKRTCTPARKPNSYACAEAWLERLRQRSLIWYMSWNLTCTHVQNPNLYTRAEGKLVHMHSLYACAKSSLYLRAAQKSRLFVPQSHYTNTWEVSVYRRVQLRKFQKWKIMAF